jgi:hypothetical protein
MEQSIITWNVPNFITVILMIALGMMLFTFVGKAVQAQG